MLSFYCFILTSSFFDINYGTKSWWLCLGIAAWPTSKPTYLLKSLFSIFLLFYRAYFFAWYISLKFGTKKLIKPKSTLKMRLEIMKCRKIYELEIWKVKRKKSGRFLKLTNLINGTDKNRLNGENFINRTWKANKNPIF